MDTKDIAGEMRRLREAARLPKVAYQEGADAYTHIVRSNTNAIVVSFPQDSSGVSEARARLFTFCANHVMELVEENERLRAELAGVEQERNAEVFLLQKQVEELKGERDRLKAQNEELLTRDDELTGFQCIDPDCIDRYVPFVDETAYETSGTDNDPICIQCGQVGIWTGYERLGTVAKQWSKARMQIASLRERLTAAEQERDEARK